MAIMVEKSHKVDHDDSLDHKHRIYPCIAGYWCI